MPARQTTGTSSDGEDMDSPSFHGVFVALQAKEQEQQRKQEKDLLKAMDKKKTAYLAEASMMRDKAKEDMEKAYTEFLARDAQLTENIRNLWVQVLETHQMVLQHAAVAARANEEKAPQLRVALEQVEQEMTQAADTEGEIIGSLGTS